VANDNICYAADNKSMMAVETCIFTCCAKTYCSAGASTYYASLVACACVPGVCKSVCDDSGDYCQDAPTVTTQNCSDCLNAAFAGGGPCDTTSGSTLSDECAADPGCAAFTACTTGCPQ